MSVYKKGRLRTLCTFSIVFWKEPNSNSVFGISRSIVSDKNVSRGMPVGCDCPNAGARYLPATYSIPPSALGSPALHWEMNSLYKNTSTELICSRRCGKGALQDPGADTDSSWCGARAFAVAVQSLSPEPSIRNVRLMMRKRRSIKIKYLCTCA